jgi:TPR repeat protein
VVENERRREVEPAEQIQVEKTVQPNVAEGVAARAYLADSSHSSLQPNEVFHQAQLFQSEGKLADAWLLYFKAAREGQMDAALVLAEQADPKYFKAEETLLTRPDVVQAHKWYVLAQQNGSELAAQRLKMLLAGLERSARAGDEQAAVLLDKWK